jgi:lipopolysaccharide export system permease protein
MRILHRYILMELLRVFLLALAGFTSIFMMVGLVQEAVQQGLSPLQVLCLIPYIIPSSLPYTIPSTILLAVTIVYGRLAADNEIMAAKSAGINVLYLVAPAAMLGLFLSFTTLYLFNHVIPAANFQMKNAFAASVEEMVYAMLKRDHQIKSHSMPYEIVVRDVQGKALKKTVFRHRDANGNYDMTAYAEEASLDFDLASRVVNVHMSKATVRDRGFIAVAQDKIFTIPLPAVTQDAKRFRDMTLADVQSRKAELLREVDQAKQAAVCGIAMAVASGHLRDTRWESLPEALDQEQSIQRSLRRLDCESHMRCAIAFGCLAFVLLGCPVAILFQRGDYLSAFITCFLPIITLYYPLVMFGLNLSKEGIASPFVLMHVGNVMLLLLSIPPFRYVMRH